MVRKIFVLIISIVSYISVYAQSTGQYTIVTNDDQILKVYNIDISGEFVYYTIKEDDPDDIKRIPVSNILIIKDAEGKKIEPARNAVSSLSGSPTEVVSSQNPVSSAKHQPRPEITWYATGEIFTNKDGSIIYEGGEEKDSNNTLWFQVIEGKNNEIMLTRAPKKMGKHPSEEYIIPDYVIIDGQTYKLTKIDKETFASDRWGNPYKSTIKSLSLPETLEEIGDKAFKDTFQDTKLILPGKLKVIGEKAFYYGGARKTFTELYIPKTVTSIGDQAFSYIGPRSNFSYRGFYQGNLTSIPDFITPDNCHQFGIDENAIENYERRIGLRK